MSKSILVTGAGGFIGSHLCADLTARGYSVVGIDLKYSRNQISSSQNSFRAVEGDFRNQELMKPLFNEVDIVFHLASAHLQINFPESEYWSINVHSLRPLMEMARQSGVQRFVHVSSVGVYGDLDVRPADEKTPCRPKSIYGETKLAGESEILNYSKETNFPAVILRPAWVYGPGCPRTLKIYKALRKRHFAMIGKGDNLRHPVYIQDMLSSFQLAMEVESAVSRVFIIGGQEVFTTNDLIEAFCFALDLPRPKIRIPMTLGKVMAAGSEKFFQIAKKNPPFSKRTLEFFNSNNSFDISKAKQLLGFHPSFNFEEGLKDSRAWLESQ